MAVPISTKWRTLHGSPVVQVGLPVRDSTHMGLADGQNNLAGWRFLRSASQFWDHTDIAANTGIPAVASTDELHVRWTTSPDANLIWVAFTYFAYIYPQSGDVKVTLSTLSGAPGFAATVDSGCVFDEDNGALEYGFKSPLPDREYPEEMGAVQRTADTGFDAIIDGHTAETDYRRPLNVTANTDMVLKIATENVLVTSAFVCEMYQVERF